MKIHIPTPLRAYTGGQEIVEVGALSVQGALDALTMTAPELRKHLFTEDNKLRSFVNVYLNDDDIRYLPAKEATGTGPEDELTIIPSIAGGSIRDLQPRLFARPRLVTSSVTNAASLTYGDTSASRTSRQKEYPPWQPRF